MESTWLIVGLGNPGAEYAKTRHNVGAWFVEKLADDNNLTLKNEKKFFGLANKIILSNQECHLLIPTTFMNLSGQSVCAIAKFYKIPPQQILVVHDDLDLPMGTARLKQGGGHGGHNGLRDIINKIGSHDFIRIRLGINHPGDRDKVTDYVLGQVKKSEKILIDQAINDAMQVLPEILSGDLPKAMQLLHTKEEK